MSFSTSHDLGPALISQEMVDFLNTEPPSMPPSTPAPSTPLPEPSRQVQPEDVPVPQPERSGQVMAMPEPCEQAMSAPQPGPSQKPEFSKKPRMRSAEVLRNMRLARLGLKKTGDEEIEDDDVIFLSATAVQPPVKKLKQRVTKGFNPSKGPVVSVQAEGPRTYEAQPLTAPNTPASVEGLSPPMVLSPYVDASSEGVVRKVTILEDRLLRSPFDGRPDATVTVVGIGSERTPSPTLQQTLLDTDVWHRPHMQQCIASMKASFLERNDDSYRQVIGIIDSNMHKYASYLLYLKQLKNAEVASSLNCCVRDLDDLIDTVQDDLNVIRSVWQSLLQLLNNKKKKMFETNFKK